MQRFRKVRGRVVESQVKSFSANFNETNVPRCQRSAHPFKKGWVKELCKRESPCLLGLQETKLKEVPMQTVASLWGMNDVDYEFSEAMGNSGGLLTIWNKNMFHGQFVDRHFIAVFGKWENKEGLVGCVNKDQAALWTNLDILFAKEERAKEVKLGCFKKGMEEFNDFIRRNSLEDVSLGGSKFTRTSDDGLKQIYKNLCFPRSSY
ncbi:LOW QUALITY PROTEIN: hypothetical protein OSB04_017159 [Centaurea solstitialis]|uniref:Uncharacterized protein n=1 Tax=Centaurea solstitialis TaxID=347529 RepID=A0AA38WKG5_9ASTR|nr:LOW QUALITY PROTEIN: hypothetical protein OSB04_017159 [Centaurea solstitialis]